MLIFEEQKVLSEHNLMLEPKLHAWNRKLLHNILQHQNHSCFELSTAKDANYALEFITHVLRPNYACQTHTHTHSHTSHTHRVFQRIERMFQRITITAARARPCECRAV